jgi:pilus assembly protein Flp/PilA
MAASPASGTGRLAISFYSLGYFKEEHFMKKFVAKCKKFADKYMTRQEEGATLAEYGLLLALIAVVCLAAITVLGTQISSMFSTLAATI